jgi:hypothetical protein
MKIRKVVGRRWRFADHDQRLLVRWTRCAQFPPHLCSPDFGPILDTDHRDHFRRGHRRPTVTARLPGTFIHRARLPDRRQAGLGSLVGAHAIRTQRWFSLRRFPTSAHGLPCRDDEQTRDILRGERPRQPRVVASSGWPHRFKAGHSQPGSPRACVPSVILSGQTSGWTWSPLGALMLLCRAPMSRSHTGSRYPAGFRRCR